MLQIGKRPLANPDEGRYAEIAREMVATGDFTVPRLNGLLYFEKPPMAYWLTAIGQVIFGQNFFGARFFNAFVLFLSVLLIYRFCRKFFDLLSGCWAGLVFGTSALVFGMSQMLTLDGTLTFFVTGTLLQFASGFLESNERVSRRHFLFAYVFMAMAVMTKGLVGIIFPAIVGLPWLLITGRIRDIGRTRLCFGLLLFLILVVPWHVMVGLKHGEFFKFYFWHEHFERYFSSVHGRTKPIYFLPLAFIVGMMPWGLFLPRAIIAIFKQKKTIAPIERHILLFGLIWSVGIVLFFSVSNSQLIPYVLPAFGGIAIVLGYFFKNFFEAKKCKLEIFSIGAAYLVAANILPVVFAKKAYFEPPQGLLLSMCVVVVAYAIGILFWLFKRPNLSFKIAIAATISIYIMLPSVMPFFQRDMSYPFANFIKQQNGDYDVYCAYEYFQDLPFYLSKTVGVVGHIPDEQKLGYNSEGNSKYLAVSELRNQWQEGKKYILVRKRDNNLLVNTFADKSIYLLTENEQFCLYSNLNS